MRPWVGTGILLLMALSLACDSSQPALVTSQTAMVRFDVTGGQTTLNRTWPMWEDTDLDGEPDDVDGDGEPDVFLWCEGSTAGGFTNYVAFSMPWGITGKISILRAGETAPETIAQSTSTTLGRAAYDSSTSINNAALAPSGTTSVHRQGFCRLAPDILCNPDNPQSQACADHGGCWATGTCSADPTHVCQPADQFAPTCRVLGAGTCDIPQVTRRWFFDNGVARVSLSSANRAVIDARRNIFYDTDPTKAVATVSSATNRIPYGGLCPGTSFTSDGGDPNLGGMPLPISVELERGDTLIVEARRIAAQPGNGIPVNNASQSLRAQLFVNGTITAVDGVATAGPDPNSFVQFHYVAE